MYTGLATVSGSKDYHLKVSTSSAATVPPAAIYPELPLDLTGFFSRNHLIQFLANKMQDFGISFYITALSCSKLNKFKDEGPPEF